MMALSLLVAGLIAEPTGLDQLAQDALNEVNRVRTSAGLGKLKKHPDLNRASVALAEDLAARSVLEHRDKRGWKLQQRVEEAGYTTWTSIGENIAYGQKTGLEVVDAWLKSKGHRAMIYTSGFTETGIAVAKSKDGTLYWVQQFGSR